MAKPMLKTIDLTDNLGLDAILRKGIPARFLTELAAALKLNVHDVGSLAQIPSRTLDRRLSMNAALPLAEADRVLRLARVFAKASDVLEDDEEAAAWLLEELPELRNRTPLAACATDPGAREVEAILGRIEHGIFA